MAAGRRPHERLTFDAAADRFPIWSPDGTRLVFRSNRTGPGDLYQKLTSRTGVEERFVASDQTQGPHSAGRRMVASCCISALTRRQAATSGLCRWWAIARHGYSLKTPFRVAYGAFSPDSRWVAYQSNESGRSEIYVRPFVPPGATARRGGGCRPVAGVRRRAASIPPGGPTARSLLY